MINHDDNNNGGKPPVPAPPAAPQPHNPDSQARAAYEQAQERDLHLRHNREQRAIDKVFAQFPSAFKLPHGEVLKTLGKVTFNADGEPMALGVPLTKALGFYVETNPHGVATSILDAYQPESRILAKSDLKTPKEKIEFINRGGDFESLPLNRPAPVDPATMTTAEFKQLGYAEKNALAESHVDGWDYVNRLQREAGERTKKLALANQPTPEEVRQAKLRGVPVENLIRQRKAK